MAAPERFLPVDLDRVVEDLLSHAALAPAERPAVAALFGAWTARFQLELAGLQKRLRALYHPFDPDAETLPARSAGAGGADGLAALCAALRTVLERANFEPVPREALERALNRISPRGVHVQVDLEEYDVLEYFVRGQAVRRDSRRVVRGGKLVREQLETPVHRRLLVFAKLRGAEAEPATPDVVHVATDDDRPRRDRLYVKLFRDVAHSDLEMLLPNTRVRMTAMDKLKLSVTGGGGTIGGVVVTAGKIGAAANPVTWGLALAGFGGVVWRQVSKLVYTRVRYAAALARKLYTRNLDSNFGAVARVLELAEEEECKEALLAWFFLALRGEDGATPAELDAAIEQHLRESYAIEADFEVQDGLRKLRAAGLCAERDDGRLRAVPAEEGRRRVLELLGRELGGAPPAG